MNDFVDEDPLETQEWLDALHSLIEKEGFERAQYILQRLSAKVTETGAQLPYAITTPYRNTIPVSKEARMPATCSWRGGYALLSAGMPWRWLCGPI